MNRLFYCLCLLLLGLGLASKKSELLAQGRITSDYLIQSEDLLRVTVFQEPTLSLGQTEGLRVSAKGNIPFPLLNEIPVAGKTVQQVKEDIERRLKDGYIDGVLHLTKLRTHTISRDHLKPMAMKVEWVFGRRNVTDLDHGIMTEW
mgnify:CR=1 FL=1